MWEMILISNPFLLARASLRLCVIVDALQAIGYHAFVLRFLSIGAHKDGVECIDMMIASMEFNVAENISTSAGKHGFSFQIIFSKVSRIVFFLIDKLIRMIFGAILEEETAEKACKKTTKIEHECRSLRCAYWKILFFVLVRFVYLQRNRTIIKSLERSHKDQKENQNTWYNLPHRWRACRLVVVELHQVEKALVVW